MIGLSSFEVGAMALTTGAMPFSGRSGEGKKWCASSMVPDGTMEGGEERERRFGCGEGDDDDAGEGRDRRKGVG